MVLHRLQPWVQEDSYPGHFTSSREHFTGFQVALKFLKNPNFFRLP